MVGPRCSWRATSSSRTMSRSSISPENGGGTSGPLGRSRQEEQHRRLCEGLISTPLQCSDARLAQRNPTYPDFIHKSTKQTLPLDHDYHKPPRINARLRQQAEGLCCPSFGTKFASDGKVQYLCASGQLNLAMDTLLRMDQQGIVPAERVYRALLKACCERKSLTYCRQVRAHLEQHRPQCIAALGEYLVFTLVKCGCLEEALQVFNGLPQRSVYSWTVVISAFVECGESHRALRMYQSMCDDCVEPNAYTFVSLFKACTCMPNLKEGVALHIEAKRKGLDSDVFVGSTLLSMYAKCGNIVEAENVFMELRERNVVSWNAMLTAYIELSKPEKTLKLYRQMQEESLHPNEPTFMMALQACCSLAECLEEGQTTRVMLLNIGQGLQIDSIRRGYHADVHIGSVLLRLYGKCGSIKEAENVFRGLYQHDVVSWTTMVSACVDQGNGEQALKMYRQMQVESVQPEKQTFVMALQACYMLTEREEPAVVKGLGNRVEALRIGQALHADARHIGFDSDVFVGSALIRMYGKCGSTLEAEDVFCNLSRRDSVSWNAMLSTYVEHGFGDKALQLYEYMQKEIFCPTDITVLCNLQACDQVGSVDLCRQMHANVVFAGCDMIAILAALIRAYGSCASMPDAQAVFDVLVQPDVICWSALIAGYAGEGDCAACLRNLELMLLAGTKPDGVTFLSVLLACSHVGLVDMGVNYFESMTRDFGIAADFKHYVSLFDLLGRAGDFNRIEDVLSRMTSGPGIAVWLCLLAACRNHGNVELGKHVYELVVHLQPKEAAAYVLMSNIYADAGLYEFADQVESARLREGAGTSSIKGQHDFLVMVGIDENKHDQHSQFDYGKTDMLARVS